MYCKQQQYNNNNNNNNRDQEWIMIDVYLSLISDHICVIGTYKPENTELVRVQRA